MANVDRARLLELLGQLGAESDEAALAAARELSQAIGEAGLSWDDLLRSDTGTSATSQPAANAPAERSGGKDEIARLIERLLARPSISDTLREELTDFKHAIADGTFEEMDAQYVRALAKRLGA